MRLDQAGLTLSDLDLGGIDAESDYRLAEYFLTTPHVAAAFEGRRTLFLGRKGAGKSAVFTQLHRLAVERNHDNLEVLTLTPTVYAWSQLKDYKEQGIISEQAHTNAWKLTLAIELASLIVSHERQWVGQAATAVKQLRQFLGDNFGSTNPGFAGAAAAILKGLKSFNFSAFGFALGVDRGDSPDPQPITPTIVASLLDAIASATEQQPILLALDRLDDSWDGSPEAQSLLVGLLKAAKDLNDTYGSDSLEEGMRVIVFLRSDIYDALQFDDKDKHRATEELITWRTDELSEMLTLRLPDDVTVDELFEPEDMRGAKPFSYIVRRTFLRPREVLQFVGEAKAKADQSASQISKRDIRSAEDRYSRWKVDDLEQEYSKVIPRYAGMLECLRQEKHRYDSLSALAALIEGKQPDLVVEVPIRHILNALFESSVIGVRVGNSGSARYKCEDADLVLPSSGAVYVHPSLYRGLGITEARTRKRERPSTAPGSVHDKITIELYGIMMAALPIQDLTFIGLRPSPIDVIRNVTFADCAAALGVELSIDEEGSDTQAIIRPGRLYKDRFATDTALYIRLREQMRSVLAEHDQTEEQYEAAVRSPPRS